MKNNCAKCHSDFEFGSTIVKDGIAYKFCKTCTNILESFPVPANIMHVFLTPEDKQSQENKNIFEARKRRAESKSLWK